MVHVCPRDSPRGMLYCGLVTTTQVSFYVAPKECATCQNSNFACLLTTYEDLLGFSPHSSAQLSYYSYRSLDWLSLLPLTWRMDRVCSYFYAHSSVASVEGFLPFKTVGAVQSLVG